MNANKPYRLQITLILCLLTLGCTKSSQNQAETVDTILTNGKVYTLNPALPWAEAVAIAGKKFIYVGDTKSAEKYSSKETRVIDLKGKMAMPGLVDAHIHPVLAGMEKIYDCNFYPSATLAEIEARVKKCVATRPDAPWIIGGRWGSAINDIDPSITPRQWLDRISGGKAISLQDGSGHNRWVNSKALELAGLDENSEIPGGEVVVNRKTGKPSGILLEAAIIPILKAIPPYKPADYRHAAEEILKLASSVGITSVKEAGDSHEGVRAYKALADSGALNHHMAVAIHMPVLKDGHTLDVETLNELRINNRAYNVDTDFVKIFLDGVPGTARTAAMLENYLPEEPGGETHRGKLLFSPEALAELMAQLDRMGITVNVHSAGDRAVRTTLDAIEYTRKVNGDSGLRHEVAHTTIVHPDDFSRFAELNATADVSPPLWFVTPYLEMAKKVLGDRAGKTWPIGSITSAGGLVTTGSDFPAALPTINPWNGIEAMITRQEPQGRFEGIAWPEQRISLEQALAINTMNGAVALKMANKIGSIEVGKFADLIVLDRNLFEVPVEEISETKVELTFFEGRIVHQR